MGVSHRQVFDEQLTELHDGVFRVGTMVEAALSEALQSIKLYDQATVRKVVQNDQTINHEVQRLHDQALLIIATQQPLARDLRLVSVVLSLLPELERMGDYAATICKLQERIAATPNFVSVAEMPQPIPRLINELSQRTSEILHAGLEALRKNDRSFADRVTTLDDAIDQLYREMFEATVKISTSSPELAAAAIHLLTLAHNLERLGDRVTNLAEQIEYLITGKVVALNH